MHRLYPATAVHIQLGKYLMQERNYFNLINYLNVSAFKKNTTTCIIITKIKKVPTGCDKNIFVLTQ